MVLDKMNLVFYVQFGFVIFFISFVAKSCFSIVIKLIIMTCLNNEDLNKRNRQEDVMWDAVQKTTYFNHCKPSSFHRVFIHQLLLKKFPWKSLKKKKQNPKDTKNSNWLWVEKRRTISQLRKRKRPPENGRGENITL